MNLTMNKMAEHLCLATGMSIIVIDCWNNDHPWTSKAKFPTLDDDQLELIGKPFAIRFDDKDDARTAYKTLCRDTIVEEEEYSCVGGRIHLYERVEYVRGSSECLHTEFFLEDSFRPVHVENGTWTTEHIPGREML